MFGLTGGRARFWNLARAAAGGRGGKAALREIETDWRKARAKDLGRLVSDLLKPFFATC